MGDFVQMPKLGMTMTEGKIVKWLKNEGDTVARGDYILEVETDKTTLEVDSLFSGVLLKQYYGEGDTVPCDTGIAYIGAAGETAPEAATGTGQAIGLAEPAPEEQPATPLPDGEAYDCDLAVIGGGPGGYVAAIRAAQLGAKVVLIEKDVVGGTCLNRGCIPTKALYTSAKQWRKVKHADEYGIRVSGAELDFSAVMRRKDGILKQLTAGVAGLLKKNKVDVKYGEATMPREHEVSVGGETVTCRYAILATGGKPASVLKNVEDGVEIFDTDKLMGLADLPASAVIVGGGVIGCEIGCILNAFGTRVTIVEMLPSILPTVDSEVAALLAEKMTANGIDIRTRATVEAVSKHGSACKVRLSDGSILESDMILEAVGRQAEDAAFAKLGLERSAKGFVSTDAFGRTSLKSVYAIGDITGISQLAHAASEQGVTAAEHMFGSRREAAEPLIPSCIFTDLEIACVGLTEAQARERGLSPRVSRFPFSANGKALTLGETEGFVKVVCDDRFGEILGVHIIGPEASTMIHEAVAAMSLEGTAESVCSVVHAHPTLSEAMMEAFLGCTTGAIHM